jgi:hypothetical protein
MWILIIAILVLLVYLADKYGVFHSLTITTETLNNPILLYYSWKGAKEDLKAEHEKIAEKTKEHFKISDGFGIYYSQPEKPLWDCVLGLLVNTGEIHKIQNFLNEYP